MAARPLPILFGLAALAPLAACATDAGDGLETDEADVEGKADSEIRVRVDGLTVWVDPAVVRADGERPWRLGARASRNLQAVSGFVPDGDHGTAAIRSPRTFELAFDDAELDTLAAGVPLFVAITPTTGDPATAAIWLAPRTAEHAGTWRLRVDTTVTPRWIGGGVVYRGGARSEPGWFLAADGASAPQVSLEPTPDRFRLDWSATTFLLGATEPFAFRVQNGAQLATKQARPRVVVRRLGLTRGVAEEVWARSCSGEVRTCLDALPAGSADASACGNYVQVVDCGGLEVAAMPALARVVADFRAHLVGYYAENPDIPSDDGNTLAEAQAAVTEGTFRLVELAEEDPHGHDLGRFWVFSHPDVAFPGSDTTWYVVYDKGTGALTAIYDFN